MGGLVASTRAPKILAIAGIVCAVTLLSYLLYVPHARAIGLTPPEVSVSSVLRNSTQTKYLTLSKNPAQVSEDYEYTTEVRSDDKGIIEVAPTIEIPAGRQSVQVPFTINTKDLANGTYNAVLLFYEKKKEAADGNQENIEKGNVGTGVSIVAGIAAKIVFSVGGEETVSYEISNVQAQSTETDDPVPVEFTVNNTGNVSWRPEKVEFLFADQLDNQNTEIVTIAGSEIQSTGPGAEQVVSLKLSPTLIQSTYVVTAVFYDDGKEVDRIDTQVFDVFPPNTLAQSGEFSNSTSNKEKYAVGEKIRVSADFENTGEIRVSGIMVTSIEKDSAVIDLRKTSQLDIDAGETSQFEDIFTLDKPGQYTLTLYVEYGNKKTTKRSLEIEVLGPESSSTAALPWILLLTLSVLVIMIAIVARSMRRGKRRSVAKEAGRKDI